MQLVALTSEKSADEAAVGAAVSALTMREALECESAAPLPEVQKGSSCGHGKEQ